jgi:hypothetical protein
LRRTDGCVKVTSVYLGIVSRLPGLLKTLTASKFCSWHRVVGPGGACVGAAIQIPFASVGLSRLTRTALPMPLRFSLDNLALGFRSDAARP